MRVSNVARIVNVMDDAFNHGMTQGQQVDLVALPLLNWFYIEDMSDSDLESIIDERLAILEKEKSA